MIDDVAGVGKMNPLTPITATAALMIKDAEIEELKAELKNQRTLLVEHAGRLNNRIKELERIIAGVAER